MAVKTRFSAADFDEILAHCALGRYVASQAIAQGTVQTNYFLETTQGRFVFRCYENRSIDSVHFETLLLAYLKKRDYPAPAPFKNRHGKYVGLYHDKPYVLFEFIPGQTIDHPSDQHKQQLIQKAAELHKVTRTYRPHYKKYRWNYNVQLCRQLAHAAAKINSEEAQAKFAWLDHQLATLELPRSLPKGICHCDFHFSNVLFQGDRFAALLDFDDANYTYLLFDLVGLIENWAWSCPADTLDMTQAHLIVQEYMKHRLLNAVEQRHLYDVYKLSILFDAVWYFGRGDAGDFYEKRKVDFLNELGREAFATALFSVHASQ
jgi:homoserine kinase type II